jgi:hypothetical protein
MNRKPKIFRTPAARESTTICFSPATRHRAQEVKMHSVIRPNAWVALKLPSGSTKVLQITPNTYVCLRNPPDPDL